jgi:glycerol-3-phosphate O-acyltransferase
LKLRKESKNNYNYKYTSPDEFDGVIDGFFNSMLEKAAGFIFRKIDFDTESLQTLKDYHDKKNIVYVSFHSSNISLVILCHLLKKHFIDLPIVALEENPFMMQTIKHVWKRIMKFINKSIWGKKYRHIFDTDYIKRNMGENKSILISLLSRKFFLKRYMEIKYDSLIYLVKLQKSMKDPICLLPEMIFWNQNPERTKSLVTSQATGDRGLISGWITTLKSATPAFVRILPPINIKEEIEKSRTQDTEIIAIALRNKLLEMYYHEKRAALGPVIRSNQEMMEKVLYHENVLEMIEKQVKREKVSERQLRKRAYDHYKDIAANYSVLVISFFKFIIDIIMNKIFDGIQYDPDSIRKIREASKKGPLILVPNHRSRIDYYIISYIFYINKLACPHVASGKNLFFFPIGFFLRRSGAFSLERNFLGLDKLYPIVFKQYLRTLVSDGYSIELFLEGTRTRTGKMRLPKLGVLYWLIEAIYQGYNEDLVFVPISIDYDRILEEKMYVKELKGHAKENESLDTVIGNRKIFKRKYGRVYISFNEPFTLKEISGGITDIKKIPDLVANTILAKISEVTVVTPFALVTTSILALSTKGFSKSILKTNTKIFFSYLLETNARLSDSLHKDSDIDKIIEEVVDSYLHDNILHQLQIEGMSKEEVVEDLYSLKDDNRTRISYYKNCTVHYFVPIVFTSVAIQYCLKKNKEYNIIDLKESDVKKEYDLIKNLFRREFVYSDDDNTGDCIHEAVYQYYYQRSVLSRRDDGIFIPGGNKLNDIKLFSSVMKDHFESYYVVLKTIVSLKTNLIKKEDLITIVRKTGLKMYHLGEIDLAESLSLPNYINAITKFTDEGILRGGTRDIKNSTVEIADVEKAKIYSLKIEEYLELIR